MCSHRQQKTIKWAIILQITFYKLRLYTRHVCSCQLFTGRELFASHHRLNSLDKIRKSLLPCKCKTDLFQPFSQTHSSPTAQTSQRKITSRGQPRTLCLRFERNVELFLRSSFISFSLSSRRLFHLLSGARWWLWSSNTVWSHFCWFKTDSKLDKHTFVLHICHV